MIKINGLEVEQFTFPGGEVNIRLPKGLKAGPMYVIAWLEKSDDIMALCLVKDALTRHYGCVYRDVTIPYMPYARQDRVCSQGEALSYRVAVTLLQDWRNITTYDIHNVDAIPSCNVTNISLKDIVIKLRVKFNNNTILVAPDLGATEKVKEVAEHFNVPWIQGHKVRDPDTGKLSGFGIEECDKGKDLIILDDICDGGGTFNGLASVIRNTNDPKTLSLYVTHGIFSRGFTALEENFDHIYTTDTRLAEWLPRKKLTQFKLVEQ